MNRDYYVDCICKGVETYLRAFALADNMRLHNEGGIEWISPKKDCTGPSLVYKVSLDAGTADSLIDKLVTGIKAGTVPSAWFVSPNWTPDNVCGILLSKGFKDLSNPDEPEPAMALDMGSLPEWPEPKPEILVKRVRTLSEFGSWCDIVNEVLHGWPMITPEHYSPWLGQGIIALYLAYLNGIPVSTAATMQDGDIASLEFVATRQEHRGRGAATAACVTALLDLRGQGVRTATLRAFHDGVGLYERLGFKTLYTTTMMAYQNE